jgi:hypothetical protein
MTLIVATVIIVGAMVFYNLWLFDRLARWEYEHHREQWERDGKPSGFLFWRPKESDGWSSGRIEQSLNLRWTFKMPDWAAKHSECRWWIIQKRISSLAVVLIILTVLVGTFYRWW